MIYCPNIIRQGSYYEARLIAMLLYSSAQFTTELKIVNNKDGYLLNI